MKNKECRISKEGGASRHILALNTRAFGAPSFDIPCSIFVIQIMDNMLVDNFW